MKKFSILAWFLVMSLAVFSCSDDDEDEPNVVVPDPTAFTVKSFVTSGLSHPLGGDLDSKGNLWVSDAGTGKDDATVVMINEAGKITKALEGLPSVLMNGAFEGISHVLVHKNKLYVMHGISGKLYIADVTNFTSTSSPLDTTKVEKVDIKTYVNSQNLVNPLNSNAYALAIGPDDDLFLTEAGSNAVIRRKSNGALSVFAKFDKLPNGAEAVPTGIVWTGKEFYVSTLSGFPFAAQAAVIYKITEAGAVSVHKSGFSLLSSLELTANGKLLATQLGVFGATGFGEAEGKVVDEAGNVLASGFGMPTDIVKKSDREFYLLNYLNGKIDLLAY